MIVKLDSNIKLVDYIKRYAIIVDDWDVESKSVYSYSKIPDWFKLSEDGSIFEISQFDLPPIVAEVHEKIELNKK